MLIFKTENYGFLMIIFLFFQCLIIGICKDLQGLAHALNTSTSFQLFFEWLYLFNKTYDNINRDRKSYIGRELKTLVAHSLLVFP